jgi:hypothetical protein
MIKNKPALKMISENKLKNYEVYVIKLNDEVKKEPKFMKAKLAEKLRKKGWGVWQN